MSVIYVLLTISIIVAVIFFIAFIVSVKNGQYDDSYTPSVRMLFEDELVNGKPSKEISENPPFAATEQSVTSKLEQPDCHIALSMTANKNKIQLNKQL